MVYLLAFVAALVNALASIMQRLGVEDAPDNSALSPKLISHMFTRVIWLAGFVFMGVGFIAQATALHAGSLTVVQPILVSELVITVLVMWLWFSMDLRPADALATVVTTGGLAGFLAIAAPSTGAHVPSHVEWIATAAAVVGFAIVFVVASRRGPTWWRALSLGAAASVGFALTAALTKTATDALAHGLGGLLTSPATYGLTVAGLGSIFLMQSAFQAGPFAASQSSLILINPIVSVILGIALFGDTLRHNPVALVGEVATCVALIVGAVFLARSPLVAGAHDENEHSLAGRGQFARWRARRNAPTVDK